MTAFVFSEISACFGEGEMDFDVFESRFDLAPFSRSFGLRSLFFGLAFSFLLCWTFLPFVLLVLGILSPLGFFFLRWAVSFHEFGSFVVILFFHPPL